MAFNSETAKKAGEKSKRGESQQSKAIRELITDDDAQTALSKLKDLAFTGQNFKALELFLAYAFGKPRQQDEEQGQKTLIVKVVEDGQEEQTFLIGGKEIKF